MSTKCIFKKQASTISRLLGLFPVLSYTLRVYYVVRCHYTL